MDDQGIIPEELEKVIEANKDYRPRELTERKPYWGIIYVLANFQNPRGICLPPGVRRGCGDEPPNKGHLGTSHFVLCREVEGF